MKTKEEYNQMRLTANEIIRQLYEAGERDQIAILHVWTTRSLEELDKKMAQMTPSDSDNSQDRESEYEAQAPTVSELNRAAAPTHTGGEDTACCQDCGTPLNEGEAKTFTVCDSCWDKAHAPKPAPTPAGETPRSKAVFVALAEVVGKMTGVPGSQLIPVFAAAERECISLERELAAAQSCARVCREDAEANATRAEKAETALAAAKQEVEEAKDRIACLDGVIAAVDRELEAIGAIHASRAIAIKEYAERRFLKQADMAVEIGQLRAQLAALHSKPEATATEWAETYNRLNLFVEWVRKSPQDAVYNLPNKNGVNALATDISTLLRHHSASQQGGEDGRRLLTSHAAADAFWKYWNENGVPHKHGFYESTWGGFKCAIAAARQQDTKKP